MERFAVPAPSSSERRAIARRIAIPYCLLAMAWLVLSDLALIDLARNLPEFAGAGMLKGGVFVLVTSLLLYFLVSQLLRTAGESPFNAARSAEARRVGRFGPTVLFGVIAAVVVAAVIAMFAAESREHRSRARDGLLTVLELKADQLELWLGARRAATLSYASARALRQQMDRVQAQGDRGVLPELAERLEAIQRGLGIEAALLLDAGGQLLAASGEARYRAVSGGFSAQPARALRSPERVALYLHRDGEPGRETVLIDYLVALRGAEAGAGIRGTLVLREDARKRFFPLLQQWPTSSPSAEIVLVRREGDQVLYLNELRHRPDAAFRMRLPISNTALATVKALTDSGAALVDGRDYRGVDVVAASRAIEGTDWIMIAKVDADEVLAPVRRGTMMWLGAIFGVMLLAALGAWTLWRQQMRLVAMQQRAAAMEREAIEKHLDMLSRYANDIILLIDRAGRIVEANERAVERYGYPRDQLIGMPVAGLRSPEETSSLRERFDKIWRDGSDVHEALHQARHGTAFPVEISGRRVDSGGHTYIQAIIRDISERKRAQAQLAESEDKYRSLFESSGDAVLLTAPDGSIFEANPEACRMFGHSEEEIRKLGRAGLVDPADPHLAQLLEERRRTGKVRGELTFLHKDGTRFPGEISSVVFKDRRGNDRTSMVIHDISARMRAHAALGESEARFRAMIEQSISGTCIIDGDGCFIYVNPRLVAILGHDSDAALAGRPVYDFVAPESRALVADNLRRRMTGETPSARYHFEAIRKDGSRITLGVHGSVGSYLGKRVVIASVADVTELRRAEEEVERTVEKLKRAVQSTIEVVSTIGELRDPYTYGHERRVGEIATAVATEMGLPAERIEGIRVAGYLHDVGKIAVPAEILSKPSRLSGAEFDLVKDHARQSYEILRQVEFPWPVAEAAWQHHERLDGSGYPRGLKGEQIILEARVLAVADTVEAMASHRPYRPGLGIDQALAEIEQGRGKRFDPQVVDACLRLFRGRNYTIPD